jgi:hypothetical protein
MKTSLLRRIGLPALFMSGALFGSALTGVALGNQPHMQNALKALQNSQAQLQAATPDKGGHRDRAIGYVTSAIQEVQAGISFAVTH